MGESWCSQVKPLPESCRPMRRGCSKGSLHTEIGLQSIAQINIIKNTLFWVLLEPRLIYIIKQRKNEEHEEVMMKIKFIVSALEMVSCGNGYKETDDDFLFLFFFSFGGSVTCLNYVF